MIPYSFFEIADTNVRKDYYKEYFSNQYPDSDDCIVLDKQAKDIRTEIDKIDYHAEPVPRSIKKPCVNDEWTPGCIGGYITVPNPEYTLATLTRSKSRSFLNDMLNGKRIKQLTLDCRNKIETKRQDETAEVFTESTTKAENRILGDTKKKQYILAIIVSSVLLASLTILLIKKNK